MAIQLNNFSDFDVMVHAVCSSDDYTASKELLEVVPFAAMDKFVHRLLHGSTIKEAYAESAVYTTNRETQC